MTCPTPTLSDAHARPLAIIVEAGAELWTKTGGGRMSSRVTNISDLVQRVTGSCLLHSLGSGRHCGSLAESESSGEDFDERCDSQGEVEGELQQEEEDEEEKRRRDAECWERRQRERRSENLVLEMEALMSEVFDAVSGVKRAYVALQDAHNPWDPERMRAADVSVVGQLRRLGVLRERYRRSVTCRGGGGGGGGGGGFGGVGLGVREVVAPYEAVAEELRREVKAREAEVENLKERLRCLMGGGDSGGKKGRSLSNKKLGFGAVAMSPSPELFEMTMAQVRETAKSFTSLIISLMRSAHWDIAAALRSIESADCTESFKNSSTVGVHHAKYALESYVCRKFFKGFDHETFYMDGSLSSLLNPGQHRRDCFTQFRDMKAMDPVELLGVLPSCQFGKFCSMKYLSIVHPRMEESFFGNSDHHRQVSGGNHPRTQFYKEFLGLAKSMWLLHLLAFSLDPAPSLFEASRGAEFHPEYMESVVRFFGGQVPAGHIVGFPVSPGFRLGSSNTKSVMKARVYLASRS